MKKKRIKNIETPLVSIITPVYNAEKFITQTINSIIAQTHQNWELLLVNDASNDASKTIIEKFSSEDTRIHIKNLSENKGAAFCRNEATKMAEGVYIAFLDSDDLWRHDKLEKQLAFMQQNDCAVSFTSYLQIDESGNSLNKRINALPKLSYKKLRLNNYIGNLTGIYNAKKLGKIYSPAMRKRQDWALWLEAVKRSSRPALGLQEDLAYYRISKNAMSANKLSLVKYNYRFYRGYLGFSKPKATYFLLKFFAEYFLVRPKQIERLK